MAPRDRRLQGRGGRRDHRGGFRPQQHGDPGTERPDRQDFRPQHGSSSVPDEQRSLLQQTKEEVERIRDILEGVLRDLEDVSAALTKAEHEKDLAEAEIEQLRESLRRLHR